MAGKGQIVVDTAQLDAVSASVAQLADNYLTEYTALYKHVEEMKQAWSGTDNEAYTTQIEGFRDDFKKMKDLMQEYSDFLKDAAEQYRQTQNDIKNKAQQLAINA